MRKITFFCLLLCLMASNFFYSQWTAQTNPGNFLLGKVHFVNETNGWIVRGDGRLLKTTDAGANWSPFNFDDTVTRWAFADPAHNMSWVGTTHGWLLCTGGTEESNSTGAILYKTVDGGNTWTKPVSLLGGAGKMGVQVQFINENTGWMSVFDASTLVGSIYKSNDGGINWTLLGSTSSIAFGIAGIFHFVNETTGWMVNAASSANTVKIIKTTDGGSTWVQQFSDNTGLEFSHPFFVNTNIGYAFGDKIILKTIDGGTNWSTSLSNQYAGYNSGYFIDNNIGWVLDEDEGHPRTYGSRVLKTINGGVSWLPQNLPNIELDSNDRGFSIFFINENNGWCTTDGISLGLDKGRIFKYTAPPLSINKYTLEGFNFYPNPAKDFIELKATNKIMKVDIYSILGNLISTTKPQSTKYQLNTSQLAKGIYLINVTIDDKIGVYKFIKE
mgnify:CR=1 FL=1